MSAVAAEPRAACQTDGVVWPGLEPVAPGFGRELDRYEVPEYSPQPGDYLEAGFGLREGGPCAASCCRRPGRGSSQSASPASGYLVMVV